jgi:PAS domain S-box-containing protein
MNEAEDRPVEFGADYHRLLFEQAGMAMVAADLQGRVTTLNHAARRMFESTAGGTITGSDWITLLPPESREQAGRLFRAALAEGAVGEFEFTLDDEYGTTRRLAAIVNPIIDPAGRRVGGLACVRDITNRLRLQERLSHASKMAALGEMAGALSHHFNNILGGIVMSVDFALASGEVNVLTRVLERTAAALGRATTLMDNLLAFAQGDFRDATVAELGEVVLDVITQTEPKLRGTDLVIEEQLQNIPVVAVPRAAMNTVLTNLIDNAIEAMPHGGTLTISLDADEHHAIVQIGDTGVGLDEEAQRRLFEPFFSTKKFPGDNERGRGLGLAVAHGIVKVLHGTVQVTSQVRQGTVFEVRLPLPGAAPGM